MKLADYLILHAITPTEFAKRIGKPQPTVSRYVNGERIPEPEMMALIVEATKGQVTPNDFYGVIVSAAGMA